MAIGPLLIPIGEKFNISIRTLSIVFVFNYFGQVVIIYFAGLLADRFGKKVIHIVFIILLMLAALIFTFINSYIIFLLLFLFMGIFSVSINIIADSSILDTFDKNRGFYLNIAHAFFGLGAISSPIIFNLVFSRTGDYRTIYLVLLFISMIVLLLIYFAKYPQVHDESIKAKIIIDLVKNKRFVLLVVFAALSFGTLTAISGWVPVLFYKYFNVSPALSNYSLAFFWIAVLVGRVSTAMLSKKVSVLKLIKVINIISFFVLAISFFLKDSIYLLIDYLILGLLIGTYPPLLVSYSHEIYNKHSSTRVAMIFSVGSIGIIIISYLTGFFGDFIAMSKIISLFSVFFLAYIFIFHRNFKSG
jgi:MFS family permease